MASWWIVLLVCIFQPLAFLMSFGLMTISSDSRTAKPAYFLGPFALNTFPHHHLRLFRGVVLLSQRDGSVVMSTFWSCSEPMLNFPHSHQAAHGSRGSTGPGLLEYCTQVLMPTHKHTHYTPLKMNRSLKTKNKKLQYCQEKLESRRVQVSI